MGQPMALSIEPTTACNLKCPECPSGLRSFSRPVGSLEFENFVRIIDDLHTELCYLNLYFQGEPYLNKDFYRMVSYAHQKSIFTATSTNAHYLDDENARLTVLSGLDKLVISMDGTDQQTYQKYRRGGDIEKVFNGIISILKWKKHLKIRNPLVLLQFIILKSNQHQINEIKKIASDLQVDHLVFKTAQLYDYSKKADLLPDNPSWSRYRMQNDGILKINNSMKNHCWRMWSSSVITWDGRIVPCCFDKDANHQMGKLNDSTFDQIWRGEEYNRFRQQIFTSRKGIEICSNCSEGTKTWA